MALDSDALIDRRRLKRRLALWRLAALAALVALVAVAVGRAPQLQQISRSERIGVLRIDGLILSDPYREKTLRKLVDDDRLAALIVRIESPGGTTFGSESLYRALRAVAEVKPVVAVMEGVAASGGYMAAIAADHIVARESTLTGSIGVILEAANFVGLMDKLGIENESIKSAPLKAEPNPFDRLSPEAREATQALVDDVHDMFVRMVADRRRMDPARARALADGRVYTGAMAADVGLVDTLGGDAEALAWLETERGVDPDLPQVEVQIDYPRELIDRLVSATFGKSYLTERLKLDGLISVWHPLVTE
jgi:protease-4